MVNRRQFFGVCVRASNKKLRIVSEHRTLAEARAAATGTEVCIYKITWGEIPVFIEGLKP